MKEAILSHGGVRGVRVALVEVGNLTQISSTSKLEGISTLNNFKVGQSGLTCWKAYKIGTGRLVSWPSLHGMLLCDILHIMLKTK